MNRFMPYLGIVAALALGIFITTFFGGTTTVRVLETIVIPEASSTISVQSPATKNPATTTSTQTVPPQPPQKNIPPAQAPASAPAPVTQTQPTQESVSVTNAKLDASASVLRSALVNIICYAPTGSTIHSISGSGIIVDPKGIILTNAHVAQYFLLADRNISCTIRSGGPAADRYDAALIYISPLWLKANPNVLTEASPNGTGEYDFALLAITKSATSVPLPSSFPYISLATKPPDAGTQVVIASYGAQFIDISQVQTGLFPTIVFGSVKDVFTFGTNTIDVLGLGGSVAAQEGSSGGGVADASGNLVGTITTSTISGATDTRSLDAVTASYIRAEYANETGQPLDFLLSKSPAASVNDFASQIPALEAIITANLP